MEGGLFAEDLFSVDYWPSLCPKAVSFFYKLGDFARGHTLAEGGYGKGRVRGLR